MKNGIVIVSLVLLNVISISCSGNITDCEMERRFFSFEIKLICDGSQKNGNDDVSCYSKFFTREEAGISVRELNTGDCRGDHLDERLPSLFKSVSEYNVSFFGIKQLSNTDLNFGNLKEFNASHNQLASLSSQLFINAPGIRSLDLSFNKIRELDTELFSPLEDLAALYLCSNLIERIDENLFKNNEKLNYLYLDNNPIKRLDENWSIFRNLKTNFVFSCPSFQEIDLSVFRQFDFVHTIENVLLIRKNGRAFRYNQIFESYRYEAFAQSIQCSAESLQRLKYFNISGLHVSNISSVIELLGPSIEVLDLSSNVILAVLDARLFQRFSNLTHLDLRNTGIWRLNFESSSNLTFPDINKKLKVLQLENNPIKVIDCNLLMLLMRMSAVKISWENVIGLETNCMGNSLEIKLDYKDDVIFRLPRNNSEFRYSKNDFQRLLHLNVSGNQLQNVRQLLDSLPSSIESLDLSENFIGKLDSHTFERFNSLKYLHLRHCNLSNFGFATFYHQSKLIALDISYNYLKKIDFYLFPMNFKELTTLNLEGNDLVEINTISHKIFPKLLYLGISRNQFSCIYLSTFLHQLHQWRNLTMLHNPSNQTHMGGVDCNHDPNLEFPIWNAMWNAKLRTDSSEQMEVTGFGARNGNATPNYVNELRGLMYLILAICTIFGGYLLVKSEFIQQISRNLNLNAMTNRVWYRRSRQTDDTGHGEELIFQENARE